MISVNFDAVNRNVFTLVERTIEVNFGDAAVSTPGVSSPTTAAVIPSVNADISDYTEQVHDAFQDWGGVENANFELDVDMSAFADKTIHIFDDSEAMSQQYNLNNVEINKVYYFKFGGSYSFADNPTAGDGGIFYLKINGIEPTGGNGGVELPLADDFSIAGGTVMCFVLTDQPTADSLNKLLLVSYYKDDFRSLPRNSVWNTQFVSYTNYGRTFTPKISSNEFNFDASGFLEVDRTKQRIDVMPFNTVSNKRIDYNGVTTEEDWLLAALGYKVSPDVDYTSGNNLLPVQGNQSYTLPSSALTLAIHGDNKVGWKGVMLITPASYSLAFAAGWIPMPSSESFNSGSSKVIIQWEAISNTECIYTLKNIA